MEDIRQIFCGSVNCYLIFNGRAAVLVDTGREAHRERVLRACRDVPVKLLVLTHGHIDHVQNAAFLSRELRVPVAMHRADVPLIEDNRRQKLYAHGLFGRVMLAATERSFRTECIPRFVPSIFLEDGDSLSDFGIDAQVIALPGHTEGSIGLAVGGHSVIVGDAMMNLPRPDASRLYHDRERMLQSVGRLAALGERRLYFGHGLPAANKGAKIV